jgi:hypothetical protein
VTGSRLRRIFLLAALSAVVPVSAFGFEREPSAGIRVSVSQGECAVADAKIVCELEASWSGVPGAEYYTASVTSPDGSVRDFGRIEGTEEGASASLSVPYVGSGTYSVTVSAYGTPPDDEDSGPRDPQLLDRRSSAGDDATADGESDVERSASGGSEDGAPPSDDRASEGDSSDAESDPPASGSGKPAPEGDRDPAAALPECERPVAEPETAEPVADPKGEGAASCAPAA